MLSGSRGDAGGHGDAGAFYAGLDVRPVDFGPALASPAPMRFEGPAGTAPMHPSYEDRPDADDRVFGRLDDAEYELQVDAWGRELTLAGAAEADLLHLHHLTPIYEAAARVAPEVPVVGQLHGTELLFLEQVARGAPDTWEFADAWAQRMIGWAQRCERLLVAPGGAERAAGLLGIEPDRFSPAPNGFDPERFRPDEVDRSVLWQRALVDEPRGWLPGADAGSVAYAEDELGPLRDGVVLLYVGRFTEVKRLGMLIRAFGRARADFARPAALAIVGGHPGEWEGEHPAEAIAATGARDVYLAGWHDHGELPEFLNASDAVILTSAREQFGQVLVEGMACGLPAVATDSFGPRLIVDDGRTGWLVERDDEDGLVDALREVVNDADERARRGRAAREDALDRFSWPRIAASVAEVFDAAAVSPGRRPR